jgi:hypothetical protein
MTTSDKRPRRTPKGAKTPRTSKGAETAHAAENPVIGDPAEASRNPRTAVPLLDTAQALATVPAAAEVPAAGKSGNGPRAGKTGKKIAEPRRIKDISVTVTPRHREDRHASIALAAYFRSESRGFAPGHELEDWLVAEEEVDQRLLGEGRVS